MCSSSSDRRKARRDAVRLQRQAQISSEEAAQREALRARGVVDPAGFDPNDPAAAAVAGPGSIRDLLVATSGGRKENSTIAGLGV